VTNCSLASTKLIRLFPGLERLEVREL
jgi:hypothetical protein